MSERFTLTDLLNNHGIVAIDTCALLDEGFEPMLRKSAILMSENNRSVIIHSSVVNEIVRFSRNSEQFLEFVIDERQNQTIAIITLDKKLSEDILLQNKICSFEGYTAKVFSLSKNGKLFPYRNNDKTDNILNPVERYKKLFHII